MNSMKYVMIAALIMHSNSIQTMKALEKKQREIANQQLKQATNKPIGKQLIEQSYPYTPRALLIFLDDTEAKHDEAISLSLINAIDENAGPIIASVHCLKLINKSSYQATKNALKTQWIIKFIYKDKTLNDLDEWTRENSTPEDLQLLLKPNKDIALLIPLDYLKSLGINETNVKKSGATAITETELTLGIKVNHMEETTLDKLPEFTSQTLASHPIAKYFLPLLYDNTTNISHIFCLRSDYKKSKKDLPFWAIFMMGHGESRKYGYEKIVGMSLDDFKNVLDFFNTKINTRLLVYISCYGAATNTEIIYKNTQTTLQKTYSFPIITHALTDAPIGFKPLYLKFNDLIKAVTTPVSDVLDYGKVMKDFYTAEGMWTANTAQIKLPGFEWFSVINANKKVVQIGSILAKRHSSEFLEPILKRHGAAMPDSPKPLDIVTFFKINDPEILLLYAQNIPFELILPSSLKSIVSMTPGNTTHTIEKITAATTDTATILDWFMSINRLNSTKIFYIKSLNKLNDVIICNIPNFEFLPSIYERFAFFMENGTLYFKKCLTDKNVCESIQPVGTGIASTVNDPIRNTTYSQKMYADLLEKVKNGKTPEILVRN